MLDFAKLIKFTHIFHIFHALLSIFEFTFKDFQSITKVLLFLIRISTLIYLSLLFIFIFMFQNLTKVTYYLILFFSNLLFLQSAFMRFNLEFYNCFQLLQNYRSISKFNLLIGAVSLSIPFFR